MPALGAAPCERRFRLPRTARRVFTVKRAGRNGVRSAHPMEECSAESGLGTLNDCKVQRASAMGASPNADQLGALDVRPLDHGEVISAEVTDGEAGGAVQGAVVVREADRADRRELD